MKNTLIYLFILLYTITISGRETIVSSYSYQHITSREGLSNQRVFSIEKDKEGVMWISTRSGIDSFDGRTIKSYKLFDEEIIADHLGRNIYLVKDNEGKIWAYTNSGKIFVYQEETDNFSFEIDLTEHLSPELFLNQFYITPDGGCWFATKEGLYYSNKSRHIRQIIPHKNINSVNYSPTLQTLFIGAAEGLYKLHLPGKETDQYLRLLLPDVHIQTTFYDEITSLLWIGTFQDGIKVIDTNNSQLIHNQSLTQLPHLPYRSIISLDNDHLLLGIDGAGVYRINRKNFTNQPFLTSNKEQGGILNGNGVYALYKDEAGNIWIGTYTGGVTFANPRDLSFDLIRHEYKNDQSLIDDYVNAIFEDREGDIWYGTNQGVSVYLKRYQQWRHFITGNVVLALCEDNSGNIWTGGYGTGLYALNKLKGVVTHLSANIPGTLTTDYIYTIHKDREGRLWVGGVKGKLLSFIPAANPDKETFIYYDIDLVNSITEVNTDTLAIATVNGFYLLNRTTGNFKHYFTQPEQAGTKSNTFIYSMYFESPEVVWFGTDGGGLNRFDLQTLTATTYSTANGLPSNYIYGILADTTQRLWISTDKGLACFDPSTDSNVMNIDLPDGLGENEFIFMSFTRLRNGSFMFGSTSGAIRFNPDRIVYQRYEAPLLFTSFDFSRKKSPVRLLKNGLNGQGKVDLKYNENSFSISFVAISYNNQKDILYSYLLEGFDEEWSQPGYELNARYTNVPPGSYKFRIRNISKEGKYLLDERELTVKVSQPFWNTPWAWFFYTLLFMAVLYFVWRFFAERIEKRQFSEKIQFFINTAHDIRTPVTLILAPLNDLKKEHGLSEKGKEYLDIAHKNTDKLFNLITQLLDFQKIDTTILPLQIAPYNLTEYLSERIVAFQPLIRSKQINLTMSLPDKEVNVWFDKDKIDKVMDNLISNAVKYTQEKGQIVIRLKQTDKRVVIEIEDNGIGIPRTAQKKIFSNFYRAENAVNSKITGSGIGLLLTKRLLKLHKGTINFHSKEGKGSIFEITLPKGNSHFPKQAISGKTYLPASPVSEEKEENEKEPEEPVDSSLKPKLMIVEDNDDLRFYLRKSFEGEYKVIAMEDGEKALAYLQNDTANLIVSDVMMPGIQGDELCREIKQNFSTSHIPVILLTAKTEKSSIITGLENGADDYITKPFDADILRMKLANVLNSRKRLREHLLSQSLTTPDEEEKEEKDATENLTPLDKQFIEKCMGIIYENLSDPDFTITHLCRELAMSRTLLYEKLKSLTGQPPHELIKMIRMKEAVKLLKEKIPVQEVAERVGFGDAKYFSTAFKRYYGVSPSKYS